MATAAVLPFGETVTSCGQASVLTVARTVFV